MKRFITFILSLAMMAGTLCAAEAQLIVYRLSGKVTRCVGDKQHLLKLKEQVSADYEINVEYESMVELLDTKSAKRYTIKTPGRGVIASLIKKKGNSVSALTQQYISYVQKQLNNNSANMMQAQRFTDFATVTRSVAVVDEEEAPEAKQPVSFEEFKKRAQNRFDNFSRSANTTYNNFVRRTWYNYTASAAFPRPQDEGMLPIYSSEKDSVGQPLVLGWIAKEADSTQGEAALTPPEEEVTDEQLPFVYNGKMMNVRLDESKRFNIGELSPDKIGDLLDLLNTKNYDNAIIDCQQLRKKHNLSDWDFVMMLQEMSQQFCGPDTNEATLLAGFLLSQSGCKMRYAMNQDHLYLLVCTSSIIYGSRSFEIKGCRYYPTEKDAPENLMICPATMQNESSIKM